MKKILVPTDFSDCATYATEVAMALAEFYRAELILFHQLELPPSWKNLSDEEKQQYPETLQLISKTLKRMQQWKDCANEMGVSMLVKYDSGKLVNIIAQQVKDEKIDFVVMGSHGASGFNEFLIGSNTQLVIRTLHCPVLIVKKQLREYAIRKLIFASNFDPSEKHAFEYLLKFAIPFEAEIHLVQINTSSWYTQPYGLVKENMQDFKNMCKQLPCFMHFYRDSNIETGIRQVAEEIDADLIAISNHHRRPVKRVFSGSNVESLVNHSDLPVLSIDYEE